MEPTTKRQWLRASPPAEWPRPPSVMSFSVLATLESCPLRWALAEARYTDLWNGRGYPPKLQLAALAGTVVHAAIRELISALVRAGCVSLATPEAVDVMKKLGGYTSVLGRSIDNAIAQYSGNPRALHLLEYATRTLRTQIPEMRTKVQRLLAQSNLAAARNAHNRNRPNAGTGSRSPLGFGTYAELTVNARDLGWTARIDLLTLSAELGALTEYKTGSPQDSHQLQVRIYALLWYRDKELNPTARQVNAIAISYPTGEVSVAPPNPKELAELEATLIARSNSAKASASQNPPPAIPSAVNCRRCDVRHMCAAYWSDPSRGAWIEQTTDQSFVDLSVQVGRRLGPTSWHAKVFVGAPDLAGKEVIVRVAADAQELKPGWCLRITDCHRKLPDLQEDILTVTVGSLSEIFVLEADAAYATSG